MNQNLPLMDCHGLFEGWRWLHTRAARVMSHGQCESLSHGCGRKADLTVPVKAGCQGGQAEDIRGLLAQPCSRGV